MKPLITSLALLIATGFHFTARADSTGTGFFISDDGYIVTNFHVVEGSSRLLVKHLEETLTAKIVATDQQNDIALLKVSKETDSFPFLRVDTAAVPTPGSDVFTVGFPDPTILGVTPKTTKGNVTASAGIKDDPRFLQISVPIQPGNSGGPLINSAGNVVGITTATINAINRLQDGGYLPQNVNYALKASYLKGVFDQVADNKFSEMNAKKEDRKFDEIQRATQDSVALIIAISQAPAAKADTPEQPPEARQPAQEEQVSPVTYIGHVGRLDAIFFLKWLPDGKVQGTYFYPKRGITKSYTLIGNNPQDGQLFLAEYTDQTLTAKIGLSKRVSQEAITWEGQMKNEDGRSFNVSFSRSR